MSKQKPIITDRRIACQSRLIQIDEIDLTFSNGEQRTYELVTGLGEAVLVVAVHEGHLLLIREYLAGMDGYDLGFAKGHIDEGETATEAAGRELMEEVGYGAKKIEFIKQMSSSPGYNQSKISVMFATDLYPQQLEGDEPEPIEVVHWPIDKMDELLARDDFSDARSIAALHLFKLRRQTWLENE